MQLRKVGETLMIDVAITYCISQTIEFVVNYYD